MTKPQNPRRFVLKHLRDLKRWCNDMVVTWDQPQSIRVPNSGAYRKLMDHEKRENDPRKWDELARWMDAVSVMAAEVADYARYMREVKK